MKNLVYIPSVIAWGAYGVALLTGLYFPQNPLLWAGLAAALWYTVLRIVNVGADIGDCISDMFD